MSYEAIVKKDLLKTKLKGKGWSFKELHSRLQTSYGFEIKYSNFMELVNNNISWKLVYAYAIIDLLQCELEDLFSFEVVG